MSQRGQLEVQSKGLKRFFGWLFDLHEQPSTHRKAQRHAVPGLVAYFPLGHSLGANQVWNISTEGFYVLTDERWAEGTSLVVTLQIVNPKTREIEAMISVPSQVVWLGPDGVGFRFDDEAVHRSPRIGITNVEQLVQLQKFLERIKK